MKRIYSLLGILLCTSASLAQSGNAVVFSELGEKFTIYLNGEKQNDTPQSNVKINDLTSEFYQARVDFEDPTKADFANNHFAVQLGYTTTYMVKFNRKGKYVLRLQGSTPVANDLATERPEPIPAPIAEPAPTTETVVMETRPASEQTTVTRMTTSKPAASGENVNVSMNLEGFGVNVNMSVDEGNMEYEETTTMTTTTSSSSTTTTTETYGDSVLKPTPKGGCMAPMSNSDFSADMNSLKAKSFEDSKLTMAKQMTRSQCLTASQIAQVMRAFSFEDTRLEYAKFAYAYCFDTENYYRVNDAFEFELTIDELNEHLEAQR